MTTLENIILNAKYRDHLLFLAIEQGSGKSKDYTNIVLNPRIKEQARWWLISEYPLLTFESKETNGTSVISATNPINHKYDENLKKFLTPTSSKAEALKQRNLARNYEHTHKY